MLVSIRSASRTFRLTLLVVGATLVTWFVAGSVARNWFKASAVFARTYAPVPLTVKYKLVGYQTDGPHAQGEAVFALRSEGSQVEPRSVTAPDGKNYDQRIIVSVSEGKRVVVEGVTRSLTTTLIPERDLEGYRSRTCDQGSEGGTILGHRVTKRAMSAGMDRVLETWVAPELGCVVLRHTVNQVDQGGVAKPLLVKEAVTITYGEPDPSLFVLPSWPERSSSQVAAEFTRMFGISGDPRADEGADRAYYANQTRRLQ